MQQKGVCATPEVRKLRSGSAIPIREQAPGQRGHVLHLQCAQSKRKRWALHGQRLQRGTTKPISTVMHVGHGRAAAWGEGVKTPLPKVSLIGARGSL